MRIKYSLLIFAIVYICTPILGQTPKDSLLRALNDVPAKRLSTYRNLADICYGTPDEKLYLQRVYDEAKHAKNKQSEYEALNDLAYIYIVQDDSLERADYYMDLLAKSGPNRETEPWLARLRMRYYDMQMDSSKDQEAIENEVKKLSEHNDDNSSIYTRIETAYKIGSSLLAHNNPSDALQYLQTAAELSSKLPGQNGYQYQIYTLWPLARAYAYLGQDAFEKRNQISGEGRKCIEISETILQLHKSYFAIYCMEKRPFYNINTRLIQTYSFLVSSNYMLSEKQTQYYLKELEALSHNSTYMPDKYSYFLALNNYYLRQNDYNNALIANDSLIVYACQIAQYNLPTLYETHSKILYKSGDYKNAYLSLANSYKIKDSLSLYNSQKSLDELQVKYDLNKLNFEKTQLEIRTKRIMLVFLCVILIAIVIICLYLYFLFRREQKLKTELGILSAKATENERMKTAFVNSICHEVRTPLNAIVGFSDLITSDIQDTERAEFSGMVQKNAAMLISMINSMLEVSNLDVSDEKLPCTSLDVSVLCVREMDRLKELFGKSEIEYILDIPEDGAIIETNEKYLSLILENVLENANKFTARGRITMSCHVEKGKLRIMIADTGCGIADDKREEVFERFVKLNSFTPGSGLGLYLCRIIVKRLGGSIRVDSSYTEGARIIVELPI